MAEEELRTADADTVLHGVMHLLLTVILVILNVVPLVLATLQ